MTTLALLPGLVAAQDFTAEDTAPQIRRYTVEMIIFSYREDVSIGSEIFVPDEPPPGDPLANEPPGDRRISNAGEPVANEPLVSLPQFVTDEDRVPDAAGPDVDAADDTVLEELEVRVPAPYNPYAPRRLEADNFELLDIAAHLSRLDAYEPMLHFGWTQAMVVDEVRESRPLSSFVTPPEGLRGDLSLYLSRYLHLAVNLEWDADTGDGLPAGSSDTYGDDRSGRYDFGRYDDASVYPTTDKRLPVIYRIDEDRIFKNGDLRYFDHPKFGVLAKVTRIEEETPGDGGDEDPGELLGDGELLGETE